MTVNRGNVEATKAFIRARLGNPYVYGGALSSNVKQGTDCSEVWQTVLEMVHGRWRQGRQSEGATTESYRYIPVGGVGPFGTIRVNNWRDIPANAAAKLAFHHGPGGGANSHMWGELDGMLIESAGSKGLVTNGRAMAVDNNYATAWAYLPGPIDGAAPPVTLGIGSMGPEVVALQQRLNTEGAGLDVDGDYGPATAAAVVSWDRRTGYARTVRDEGIRRNITPRGIQIAFSVVFVESGWKMYANSKVPESMGIPHDAVGTDHDSVGLFQQRCPMWGPANVLMDPTKSAGLFYDRLAKMDYNNTSRLPGDYAADVQRPAAHYRGRYQEHMGHAIALYTRLATVQPAPTTPPAPPTQGDDELSAEAERMIREMYGEWRKEKRGPSRSFLAVDGQGVESPLGFLYNIDGNVWTQQLTWAYLFHVPLAIEVVESVAENGAYTGSWVESEGFNQWLNEFGQVYCQGLVGFKKAMVSKLTGDEPQQASVAVAPAADNRALEAENARLRNEIDRLQAEAATAQPVVESTHVPAPYIPAAPAETLGQRIGRFVDSVDELGLADASDIRERVAIAASIKVLETKNGSEL